MSAEPRIESFCYIMADGGNPTYELGALDIGLRMRLSRRGRRVLTFPSPYGDLEIAEGEHVGPAKGARIEEAITRLQEISTT